MKNRQSILLVAAIVVQAIIFLGALFGFLAYLPKPEAWQAAAFLLFFGSFV